MGNNNINKIAILSIRGLMPKYSNTMRIADIKLDTNRLIQFNKNNYTTIEVIICYTQSVSSDRINKYVKQLFEDVKDSYKFNIVLVFKRLDGGRVNKHITNYFITLHGDKYKNEANTKVKVYKEAETVRRRCRYTTKPKKEIKKNVTSLNILPISK